MKHLVILAGGASTRMKTSLGSGLTPAEQAAANTGNKGLIVLEGDNRPVLDYLIKNAAQAQYNSVVIVTGEDQSPFLEYYANSIYNQEYLGVDIRLAKQRIPEHRSKPWGTADALLQAIEQVSELRQACFAVCNCDNLYSVKALKLLQQSKANNALVAYDRDGLEFAQERIAKFAAMKFDNDFRLLDILEKPSVEQLKTYKDASGKLRVSMNLFKFNGPDIYSELVNCQEHLVRKEKELPTALVAMAKEVKVVGIPLKEHVPDLTSKEDIQIFKDYLKGS